MTAPMLRATARSFRAEWLKLVRPLPLAGVLGSLATAASLATVLVFSLSGGADGGDGEPGNGEPGDGGQGVSFTSTVTVARLSEPDGFVEAFGVVGGGLVPLVALALFAGGVGAEYRHGTLRTLLLRQPRRAPLFLGKLGALSLLLVAAVGVAMGVTVLTGLALAPSAGVDAGGWLGLQGVGTGAAAVVNTSAQALGWGVLGAALAVALRSSAAAIGLGLGYLLVVESLAGAIWEDASRWLPGRVLDALGAGGTATTPYGLAWALGAVYVLAAVGAGTAVLVRRDVT